MIASHGKRPKPEPVETQSYLAWALRMSPVALGAGAGFLYYRFVGCRTGTCPITRNPWISTIYGAILGSMFIGR
jgi:hypothetical protein